MCPNAPWFRLAVLAAGLLLPAACGDSAKPATASQDQPPPPGPLSVEHDFGILPHGESRTQDFTLDLARLGEPYVPLRVHLDCACGHADIRYRKADGSERAIDGAPSTANLPATGESLVLRIVLETKRREPIDLAKTTSRGFVLLQHTRDADGTSRVQWPIVLRFGIDAPFVLRPQASFDFGRVARSRTGSLTTTVRGDDAHRYATLGEITCSDPAVAVRGERREDHWLLHATCTPGELGNHRALVSITTDVPGYTLELAATWKVVEDLEASPLAKIAFRAELGRPQAEAEAAGQFVLVTDHDVRRPPEFAVQKVVDAAGRDLSKSVAVWLEPVPDQPRQHRLFARYLGGLAGAVRGSIVLTKNGDTGPFLPIELVVFDHKR